MLVFWIQCCISRPVSFVLFLRLCDMGAAMGKPHRLPAAAWLVLGVLIGLHLPVLKSLFDNRLLSCTGICPQQQRDVSSTAAPAGPAAAFGSFVYPTWPVNQQTPTVRAPCSPTRSWAGAAVNRSPQRRRRLLRDARL